MSDSVLLFSDLHAHQYREFAHVEGGISSRLAHILKVLDWVVSTAYTNNIQDILFAGDLFHVRSNLDTPVLQLVRDSIRKSGLMFHLLTGNHDQYDKQGTFHTLAALDDIAVVVGRAGLRQIGEYQIGCVPYCSEPDSFKKSLDAVYRKDPHFIVIHQGFQEAIADNGCPMDWEPLSVNDLPDDIPILSGHIHRRQKIRNVLYLGSPLQHTFGEVDQEKGVTLLLNGKFHFQENTLSPRFHKMNYTSGQELDVNQQDYYWFTVSSEDVEELEGKLADQDIHYRVSVEAKRKAATDRVLEHATSFDDMVEAYVNGVHAENPELKGRVVDYGKRIIRKVLSAV